MPNWCENYTTVYGTKDKLQKFIDKVTPAYPKIHGEISLSRLRPMPMVLRKRPKQFQHTWSMGPISQEEKDIVEAKAADYEALCIQKTGYKDWFNWAENNWGTKWADCDTSIANPLTLVSGAVDLWTGDQAIYCIEFSYQTAWGPFSTSFWDKVSKKYKDLVFVTKFNEPGMDFLGIYITRSGITKVAIEERISEVSHTTEDGEWDDESWSKMYDFLDTQARKGVMRVGLCLK